MSQDARDQRIAELEAENKELREQLRVALERIAVLERQTGRSSRNSSQPPSADTPEQRGERKKKGGSGRKPGGQPGHKARMRALLPPEKVTRIENHFPPACSHCGDRLPRRECETPLIHQVVELPPIEPDVTEHRMHEGCCGRCGHTTRATLPDGVPTGMCGPALMAFIALLTGFFHLSRRNTQRLLDDVLGVTISLGALSKVEARVSHALKAPVEQAHAHAVEEPVKHVDGTTWRNRGQYRALWTIATKTVSVFRITASATLETIQGFLQHARGILVSDRGGQLTFWAMERRQICWAHLLRKFVEFSEHSRKDVAELGESLLFLTHTLFHSWHRVRDGTLSRGAFEKMMLGLEPHIEQLLERGASLGVRGVSGSFRDILDHRLALWTFVRVPGVEPTNNHAERELRRFVQWRKTSQGSQSERGERFAERMMTVVHTVRKQKRHVLSFLTDACTAALRNQPPPKLVA